MKHIYRIESDAGFNSTMSLYHSKREISKADQCKAMEIAGITAGLAADVAGDMADIPGWGFATAGVAVVAHTTKAGLDIAMTAMDCSDIPFDEIKEILDRKFKETERKLDEHTIALQQIEVIATKTLAAVERVRYEMKEGFERLVKAIKSSKIEDAVTKIKNFVDFFYEEKERIEALPKTAYIDNLEKEEFLEFLRDSRTPKEDSLRTPLYEILDQDYAIPISFNDNVAFQALYALDYGTQNFIAVMYFLIKSNSYLADYYYQKGDLEKFNNYFDKVSEVFQGFQHSLVGKSTKSHESLLEKVIKVLEKVKNLSFIEDKKSYDGKIKYFGKIKNEIKSLKLPLILDTPLNAIKTFFQAPDIPTPLGEWKTGRKVSYAIQFREKDVFSKVSEWTKPIEVLNKACVSFRLPNESKRRERLIFRRFGNDTPQLVGVLNPSVTEFRDIHRDLYNAVGNLHEDKANSETALLLRNGANLHTSFEKERRPIHALARQGNYKLAKQLIESNPDLDINIKDNGGYTPLHIAAEEGENEFVKLLQGYHARPNEKTTNEGLLPLHLASRKGFYETVEILLQSRSVSRNGVDKQDYTPLHYAIIGGQNVVKMFLKDLETQVDAQSITGLTPLHLAAIKGDKEIVDILLSSKRGDVNKGDFKAARTPLHFAAFLGHTEIVESLIQNNNVKVYARTPDNGWTPLHFALFFNKPMVAEALIKAGSSTDINLQAYDGVTGLHLAIAKGLTNIVSSLLKKRSRGGNSHIRR